MKNIILMPIVILFLAVQSPAQLTKVSPLSQISPRYCNFHSVSFVNENSGTIIGDDWAYLTTDGGNSWAAKDVSGHLSGVFFIDAKTGFVTGDEGRIYRTTDGGATWNQQETGVEKYNGLSAITFSDARTGIAVGDHGVIVRTTDGGNSWVSQKSGNNRYFLNAVSFANNDTGIAVGEQSTVQGTSVRTQGILLRTTDGGATWKKISTGTTNQLFGVSFPREGIHDVATVVGENGLILRSEDYGKTWKKQKSGTKKDLHGVFMFNAGTAWAVGSSGTVLFMMSGEAWETQTSETDADLEAVSFTDFDHGTIVGRWNNTLNTCTVLHTSDGVNWKSVK